MGFFSKIFKGITNLIGDVIGFLVGADFDDQSQAEGVLVNKSSNIANIPVIYGTRKVGGTRVFLSTSGNDNQYLYIALALCEGEISSIGDVYINDVLSTDNKYNGLVTLDKTKTGTDDQTVSSVLTGATDTWSTDHRLRGVAYLAVKLKWDQDVFGGIPDIKCVVNGRKVYDPRDSNQSDGNPQTWTFSSNPALCLRDYLTNDRFGKGLLSPQINGSTFESAADVCDTTVTEYSGSSNTQKLLEMNAVIDTGKTLFDNVKIMLQGMRGLMPFQDGKYSLLIDAAAPSGTPFRLDDSNITSAIQVTASGKNKKYNRVRAKFVNPEANWQEDSVDWPPNDSTYSTFLSEDNGEELLRNVTLNTITNYYSARDLARIICRASREHQLTVEVTALPESLAIAVGDVVELEHDSLGWTGAAIQDFRVLAMGLQEDGEVKLTLQEYSNVYTWQEGPQEDDSPNTTIPNPFDVQPISGLSLTQGVDVAADGSEIPYLDIAFTASNDAFVVEYLININPSAFDPSEVRMSTAKLTAAQLDGTDPVTYLVQPALVDTYTVSVVAVNDAGVRSSAESATIAITGDTTAPSSITLNTPVGSVKAVGLTWTNPNNDDFAFVRIQRRVLNTGSYVSVQDVFGTPSSAGSYIDSSLADGVTYQYRAYAYDWSRNQSSVSNVVSATTLDAPLETGDLEPRSSSGYLYKIAATSSATNSVSTPSASNYNWSTGLFGSITNGWTQDPTEVNPVGTAGEGIKFWAARYYVAESTYNDGTTTAVVSTPFSSFLFEGLVTFTSLNTELADSASSLVTTIDGGLIKTGVVDLANQHGMAIRQGKTAYSSNTDGFWIGNDSGQPKVNIGDTDNYLKWDGADLVTTGLVVEDSSGFVLLDAGGVKTPSGNNYIFNSHFNDGITGWTIAPNATLGSTVIFGYDSTLQKYYVQMSAGYWIQTEQRFPLDQNEPLYMFGESSGSGAYYALVQYDSSGGQAGKFLTGGNVSPSFGSSVDFRIGKIDPDSGKIAAKLRIGAQSGGGTVKHYFAGVSSTPPVIDPAFASTYIRNASIGTAQIGTLYVTDLTGDVNTITSFQGSAFKTTGPSSSGYIEMFTVICEQNSQSAIYHQATISGCFSAKYATDTANIKLEWRARTTRTQATNSWTGWSEVNILKQRSAGGGSSFMDLPFAGGTGTTHNVDVQFRVSVYMTNDADNGTTTAFRSSTMEYSGTTIGVV